jgi:hypothetical protein
MRLILATLALTTVAMPALAEDLLFDLINNSSVTLQEMYASPVGDDSWGEDILGQDVLNSGEVATVTIADGEEVCEYDLRFVADTGAELSGSADLCAMGSFTLTD